MFMHTYLVENFGGPRALRATRFLSYLAVSLSNPSSSQFRLEHFVDHNVFSFRFLFLIRFPITLNCIVLMELKKIRNDKKFQN